MGVSIVRTLKFIIRFEFQAVDYDCTGNIGYRSVFNVIALFTTFLYGFCTKTYYYILVWVIYTDKYCVKNNLAQAAILLFSLYLSHYNLLKYQ